MRRDRVREDLIRAAGEMLERMRDLPSSDMRGLGLMRFAALRMVAELTPDRRRAEAFDAAAEEVRVSERVDLLLEAAPANDPAAAGAYIDALHMADIEGSLRGERFARAVALLKRSGTGREALAETLRVLDLYADRQTPELLSREKMAGSVVNALASACIGKAG